MAIGDRLHRATERVGPAPCAHPAPCRIAAVRTELVLRPDGTRQAAGAPPPPLCGGCPERESSRPTVRHIEVVRDLRNQHGVSAQEATSAATLPSVARDGGEEEPRAPETTDLPTTAATEAPDDGLPAAWGPDHPARLALGGREPPPAKGSRNLAGGPAIRPEDFGL